MFESRDKKKMGSTIGKYKVEHLIAAGTFGKVYLSTFNGRNYAIKEMVEPSKLSHKVQIENEIKVLADMNHNNIVRLYEVIKEKGFVYLVMEFCQTDMREFMADQENSIEEASAFAIAQQIILGMGELVKNKIVHRDLKPANILIAKGVFKIADFGLSKYIQDEYQMLKTRVGTPFYMAPQILKNERYTSKCDIWSLGIIFYQLVFGRLPWHATNEESLLYNIYNVPLNYPKPISNKMRKLLQGMIAIEECHRFSWDELLKEIATDELEVIERERIFHKSTMEKLINLEINQISLASFGKKYEMLVVDEKRAVIMSTYKNLNEDNKEACNYFLMSRLKG